MPIVIKKRVSLDFLGEGYKEAYLIFKSIPAIDFDEVITRLKLIEDKQESSINFLVDLLKRYFIKGEFPNDEDKLEPVTSDDIGQLDPNGIIECFKVFTGQDLSDPKVPEVTTSPTPSTTIDTISQ